MLNVFEKYQEGQFNLKVTSDNDNDKKEQVYWVFCLYYTFKILVLIN